MKLYTLHYPLSTKLFRFLFCFIALFTIHYTLFTNAAEAGVVLKIRAVNPLKREITMPIKYYLPKGIKPEDIINKGDLLIKFDEANGLYYAEKQMILKPKKAVTLEVEVRDVWMIPEERIEGLRAEARQLTRQPLSKLAGELKEEIIRNLGLIAQKQEHDTVGKVGVERHIQAYEENIQALKQAEIDLEVLRNLTSQTK